MQIIEAGNHNGKWICGVLLDEEKANERYQRIKHTMFKPYLVSVHLEEYPIFAIRSNLNSFSYYSLSEFFDFCNNFNIPEELDDDLPEEEYDELFVITKDYYTKDADFMYEILRPVRLTPSFVNTVKPMNKGN